ncbi:hypothetical protein PDIDSM_1189 [Penicillium digitatum]|nr:hypothetical protein PDIDSM_1189 [Penicillium digitatum]
MATPRSVQRLQQTLSHVQPPLSPQLSLVAGPAEPELLDITLGELLTLQALQYGTFEGLVFLWTGARWTYGHLKDETDRLARGMLASGIQKGDRIGIMAGNCEQYISVFFAAARVGAILVVLNNTYTPSELYYALNHSESRMLFITPRIGRHNLEEVLIKLGSNPIKAATSESLEEIVILRDSYNNFPTYQDVMERGLSQAAHVLQDREAELRPDDVCNLQFTSGSTGSPKAAMLTHHNLVNNSRFIGDRMNLTSFDILCCPPPLFHCFGLVLGNPCRSKRFQTSAQASWGPAARRLFAELHMTEYTSSYGLTEASPTCFNAFTTDSIHTRLTTVGKILPHARAKIIDAKGNIVPVGQRGELCIAGYQLTKGYWNNPEKTAETFITDTEGVKWLKTGDEASFNDEGYCTITGRFKDIIIRGGENIYPLEIEERLTAHPSIELASVIGIPDSKYGEVVGAFITITSGAGRPTDDELRAWTRETLGRHKAPQHVFVFGEEGASSTVPVTGSGKVRKVELRQMAMAVLAERQNA